MITFQSIYVYEIAPRERLSPVLCIAAIGILFHGWFFVDSPPAHLRCYTPADDIAPTMIAADAPYDDVVLSPRLTRYIRRPISSRQIIDESISIWTLFFSSRQIFYLHTIHIYLCARRQPPAATCRHSTQQTAHSTSHYVRNIPPRSTISTHYHPQQLLR
jgi:hypothetical protein